MTTPYPGTSLAFQDGPHSVECFSLNKSTSYLSLCLTEFFLRWDIKTLRFIKS